MQKTLQILVVEDNDDDALIVEAFLDRSFLTVEILRAATLHEAMSFARTKSLDLALIDLELPDSSGLETLHHFIRGFPLIPTIALTGVDDEQLAIEALKNGAQDYLAKNQLDAHTISRAIRYAMERHATEKKLADSERLLRFAIDQMPVPVVLANAPDGQIVKCNQPAYDLMSVTPPKNLNELQGERRLLYWHCCYPDGTPYQAKDLPLSRAIREGKTTKNLEVVIKHAHEQHWVSASTAPLHDEQGKIVAGILVFPEITQLKKAQQALLDSKSKIHQYERMEAIGQLAGGVAHDFNNLLTVITSFAEFGIDELRNEDPLKSDLIQILDAADRGSSLTRQLLAFSKKQVMEPEILNINSLLGDLEKMLRRLIGENIEFTTEYAAELGKINADPAQIDQVVMNLVVNARDAMPEGGNLRVVTNNIKLNDATVVPHLNMNAGEYIHLQVSDTGKGIPDDTVGRIFEPFFTTKTNEKGTGLGLSTVYGIVKQSNGFIEVSSTVGKGTTFDIYFPQVQGDTSPPIQRISQYELGGNETILVVEDDKAVRTLAQRILTNAGYNVIIASNGGEALLECEKLNQEIHLVLTDVIMPKMNGSELVKRISSGKERPKVLFMSGYTDNDLARHGILRQNTHFISKPFRAKDLLKKVRFVLDSP